MKVFFQIKRGFLKELKDDFKNIISELQTGLSDLRELKRLMIIMGKKQDKINQQAEQIVALGTEVLEAVNTLKTSIEAETAQIDEFVAGLPENVDTTAIDEALDRLVDAVNSTEGLSEKVSGIFTPVSTGGDVTPPTPTPEPVPAPPVTPEPTPVIPDVPTEPTTPDVPAENTDVTELTNDDTTTTEPATLGTDVVTPEPAPTNVDPAPPAPAVDTVDTNDDDTGRA